MKLQEMLAIINDVKPYDKGTAVMWTDNHISKYLLDAHINPDINMASRKSEIIDKIVQFIQEQLGEDFKCVLDLGCGPGLYTSKLATKGYDVTGIDFSQNSIAYAKEEAKKQNLNINYICKNYLEMNYDSQFDLITMIYCDFGVLSTDEQFLLIKKIYKALKPGGTFIVDVLNEKSLESMSFTKDFILEESGFWSPKAHITLSQSHHFEEHKAILDQHLVVTEDNHYELYHFWNHYFNQDDIQTMFNSIGFSSIIEHQNLIENDGLYNNEGVSFYQIKK